MKRKVHIVLSVLLIAFTTQFLWYDQIFGDQEWVEVCQSEDFEIAKSKELKERLFIPGDFLIGFLPGCSLARHFSFLPNQLPHITSLCLNPNPQKYYLIYHRIELYG